MKTIAALAVLVAIVLVVIQAAPLAVSPIEESSSAVVQVTKETPRSEAGQPGGDKSVWHGVRSSSTEDTASDGSVEFNKRDDIDSDPASDVNIDIESKKRRALRGVGNGQPVVHGRGPCPSTVEGSGSDDGDVYV